MTLRRYIPVIAAMFIAAALIFAWRVRRDDRINVVLVIVDTLRPDHLGCYGRAGAQTPAIDALASNGTQFSCVVTAAPVTAPSITTIVTSTYPPFHGVRDNKFFALNPALPTIASVFRGAGYRTAAFVGSMVLDRRYGLGEGFDHYDDDMSAEFKIYDERYAYEREDVRGIERRAGDVTKAAVEWLRKQGGKDAFFCMVHYFDPHLPYDPPPPFRERFLTSLYDGEIAYTDAQIGELLAALAKMGIRERTLVVITADHGEGLGGHGEDAHGFFIYDSTVLVPLVFNLPGKVATGRVIDAQVRSVDIMPTILDLAGLGPPESAQGTSLAAAVQGLEEPAGVADRDAYIETFHTLYSYEWHELQGIRTAGWKYIRAPQCELYDLRADPGETVNLFQDRAEEIERFEQTLSALERGMVRGRAPFTAKRVESEPEVVKKMRALGYVGTDAGDSRKLPEPGGDYPDPKVMMDKLDARLEAKRLLRDAMLTKDRGDIDGALQLLASAESLVPNFAEVISLKGTLLARKGKPDEGIRLIEKALEMSSDSEILSGMLNNLGIIYYNKPDYEKAVDCFEKALALQSEAGVRSPAMNQTLSNLGLAYHRLGDCDKAIEKLERSLAVKYEAQIAFRMSSIYEECGYPGKAADRLEQILRVNQNLDPDFIATVRKRIDKLRAGETELR